MPIAVGIDLGTTNSVVAFVQDQEPQALVPAGGRAIMPSVIGFRADGSIVVGDAARNEGVENAARTVYSVKRLMGRSFADIEDGVAALPYPLIDTGRMVAVPIDGRNWTPPELSALILGALRERAFELLRTEINGAVITVPAYFNDAQRQATRDAGRIAGLEVLRIINEPTAAALAYGLDREERGAIAVYDLGGGTFDVSILDRREGALDVRAVGGDTHLGGDDFDAALFLVIAQRILQETGADVTTVTVAAKRLRRCAESLKIVLSIAEVAEVDVTFPELGGLHYRGVVTRTEFEDLIAPLVQRTVEPCLDAIRQAGYEAGAIGAVALVGGSTRIPLVRRVVRELFGVEPRTDLDPDQVVALGAAVQASVLTGGITLELAPVVLDVTPLSLGVEAYGGGTVRLLPRNSKIPAFARDEFTTAVDKQTSIDVHVVQGERERAADNRSLARFKLPIVPQPAGLPRVQVTYLIDANGILNVTARDLRGGAEQNIQVQPSYGLTDDEVDAMMLAAQQNREADSALAAFHHAQRAADLTLAATEKALASSDHSLSATEVATIELACVVLRDALKTGKATEVEAAAAVLDDATRPLAREMMDEVVQRVRH